MKKSLNDGCQDILINIHLLSQQKKETSLVYEYRLGLATWSKNLRKIIYQDWNSL